MSKSSNYLDLKLKELRVDYWEEFDELLDLKEVDENEI